MKVSDDIPLHSYYSPMSQDTMFLTHKGEQISKAQLRLIGETEGTQLVMSAEKVNKLIEEQFNNQLNANVLDEAQVKELEEAKKKQLIKKDEVLGEGYKDLHTVVMQFFSKKNKSDSGIPLGLLGMLLLVPCAPWVAWIHFGRILGVKSLPREWILRVLGSIWAPFCMAFEGPQAPGHASGGFLCPSGGLDPFWDRACKPKCS